jgi:hypothetical protein
MVRHVALVGLVAFVAATTAGCAVYSQQDYGPQNLLRVDTLAGCIAKAGAPDVMQKSGTDTIVVYRSHSAIQVLGIYGSVKKKDRVIVFGEDGKFKSEELINRGEGIAILGAMSPTLEVE